jgi:ribosomal protein S6--L-glutamate ligase
MAIRIGIITVRGPDYHPNRRLLEAACAAGHRGFLIHPYHLWPENSAGTFGDNWRERLRPAARGAAKTGRPDWGCLSGPDPPVPTHGHAIGQPSVEAVTIARNKFLTQQVLTAAGLPCPDTVFVNEMPGFLSRGGSPGRLPGGGQAGQRASGRRGVADHGPRGCPSTGAARPGSAPGADGPALPAAGERRDIRALVIGGELICAAALVPPPEATFRANFHLGGRIRPTTLSDELGQTAVICCNSGGVRRGRRGHDGGR